MKRKTIALILTQLDGMYQYPIWCGAADAAEANDLNLLVFLGKSPRSPIGFEVQENIIYSLPNPEKLDGVILVSGALMADISYETYLEFCKPFQSIPAVSISVPVSGMTSILIDSKNGMKQAVLHLIKEHRYRRIAFIKGPENHPEALQRFNAYREALEESGIPHDPLLVVAGDFRPESGRDAVRILMDERGIKPDAIVSANDNMAYTVFEEIKKRGYFVPEDIALTGFDDQEDMRYLSVPYTTVSQPLYRQSVEAVGLLNRKLNGEDVEIERLLPSRLIIRQTCGCLGLPPAVENSGSTMSIALDDSDFIEKLKKFLPKDNAEMEYTPFLEPYLESLRENLIRKGDIQAFLKDFNRIITSFLGTNASYNGMMTLLEYSREISAMLSQSLKEYRYYDSAFRKALILTAGAEVRNEAQQRLSRQRLMHHLHDVSQTILSSVRKKDLYDKLRNILPELSGLVDTVSVSLNAADPMTYEQLCNTPFGEAGFQGICDFLREAPAHIPHVVATAVTVPGLDIARVKALAERLGVEFREREYAEVG